MPVLRLCQVRALSALSYRIRRLEEPPGEQFEPSDDHFPARRSIAIATISIYHRIADVASAWFLRRRQRSGNRYAMVGAGYCGAVRQEARTMESLPQDR